MITARAGVTAIAAVTFALGLSACGSGDSGEKSNASSSSTTGPSSTTAAPSGTPSSAPVPPPTGPALTIDQYVQENGIISAPVLQGDPGAPTITLPLPEGWEIAGPRGPEGAYDALIYTGPPPSPTPPTIVAFVSKLTGAVDPAKVLEYAPNETKNLPGFKGAESGQKSNLGGFDATQIGGFYTKDGVDRLIAQKTVVIPAQDGVFVLKISAEGTEDLAMPLMDATSAIDEQTTITP